jgi:hypothetical protein
MQIGARSSRSVVGVKAALCAAAEISALFASDPVQAVEAKTAELKVQRISSALTLPCSALPPHALHCDCGEQKEGEKGAAADAAEAHASGGGEGGSDSSAAANGDDAAGAEAMDTD